MKLNLSILATVFGLFIVTTPANAALTAVSLAGIGSSATLVNFEIGKTLNDTFNYLPNNPTSTTPNVGDGNTVVGFHGDGSAHHWLDYSFSPIMTSVGQTTTFVIDLWGRGWGQGRDNNFSLTLYNGNFSTVVTSIGTPNLLSIPDSGTPYLRTSFTLSPGMTFDRFRIDAPNTPSFTIAETRAAFETVTAVPEPAAGFLASLGSLILLRRRRH